MGLSPFQREFGIGTNGLKKIRTMRGFTIKMNSEPPHCQNKGCSHSYLVHYMNGSGCNECNCPKYSDHITTHHKSVKIHLYFHEIDPNTVVSVEPFTNTLEVEVLNNSSIAKKPNCFNHIIDLCKKFNVILLESEYRKTMFWMKFHDLDNEDYK